MFQDILEAGSELTNKYAEGIGRYYGGNEVMDKVGGGAGTG